MHNKINEYTQTVPIEVWLMFFLSWLREYWGNGNSHALNASLVHAP